MGDDTVTTGVDYLLNYLKGKDRVAMQDIAVELKVPLDIVQAWVDFLVEERILGVEYQFTKPLVYLNKESKGRKGKIIEQIKVTLPEVREQFYERAKSKQIPLQKIPELWSAHVFEALDSKKNMFYEQASKKKISDIDGAWEDYRHSLLTRST